MPAAEASDGEAPDSATFVGHGKLDVTEGAERDQGAVNEDSAATNAPESTRGLASPAEEAAVVAAREAAAAATAAAAAAAAETPGLDPAPGPDSPSGSAAAINAGEASASGPLTEGDGDSDPQQEEPPPAASPSAGASARAMVRDDNEADGDGQPKRVTLQNYASRDSGAVMLESSPLSKGMPNLLLDSKDKYAITPCEQQQWAVLGLSEDILVKTIIVGSHEKYSSLLKEFQVRFLPCLVRLRRGSPKIGVKVA